MPLLVIGVFGASLFYGDAVLTPAISVLSAVEGLEVGTEAFKPYVVPIAVGVLAALFAFQARGTETVGRFFGPVTLLWFIAIGAAGMRGIAREPAVLEALNPLRAAFPAGACRRIVRRARRRGARRHRRRGALRGYGALRQAPGAHWLVLAGRASLVLNYFGQGALLMTDAAAVANPFYWLLPGWALYPMVALATAATVIASQAVISGAYSITRQAVQLGFLPRVTIVHTSPREIGQVYIPSVNWVLCAMVIGAVIGFGSSSRLAGAYGVAVTGTMLVDTLLTFFVIRYAWRYRSGYTSSPPVFLIIDLAFFSATLLKTKDGGWFPLVIGGGVFLVMSTWRRGRELLLAHLRQSSVPLEPFLKSLFAEPPQRVPGTAVFLTATPDVTPHAAPA